MNRDSETYGQHKRTNIFIMGVKEGREKKKIGRYFKKLWLKFPKFDEKH